MVFGVLTTTIWKFVAVPLNRSLGAFPEVFIGITFGTLAFVIGSFYTSQQGTR
jgi:hypothetical protein